MFSDLVLIHRPGGQGSATLATCLSQPLAQPLTSHWFFWQTCLRQITIGEEHSLTAVRPYLQAGDELMHGEAAYRFLLQIICGLHSPLLGETEVYGQFKNAVAAFEAPTSPWGSQLKRFFRALFEDAKSVRLAHLEDLGSQSYGSVLRRELRGLSGIHVLGAGQLAQEILPWIAKDLGAGAGSCAGANAGSGAGSGARVRIHARDPEKARGQLSLIPGGKTPFEVQAVRTDSMADAHGCVQLAGAQVVIVAAPVQAEWLEAWLMNATQLVVFVDLRADSSADQERLMHAFARRGREVRSIVLNDVFSRISQNQALLAQRKAAALAAIEAAVRERNSHIEIRPFGWEDVCA